MAGTRMPPLHPGEILREEFLLPLALSAGALAKVCGVPRTRIERVATEAYPVTTDTALRLAKALGTTPEFWINAQKSFDLETTRHDIAGELQRIKPVSKTAA